MNIIEAWKAANNGDEISNGRVTVSVKNRCEIYQNQVSYLSEAVKGVCDCHLLSEDWKVVKKEETEKKKREIGLTMGELREVTQGYAFQYHVPDSAKVTIEWTE